MRERLLLNCVAILLLASFAAFGQEFKPEALYKKAVPSVMTLKADKRDGSIVLGSAFLLTNSGIAATAWHVVNEVTHVSARFSDGEEFEVSGLLDKDEKRDLALIRVKVFGRPQLTVVGDDPQVGSRAYVIGAPLGLEFSITEGLLSQIQHIDNVKQYQFSSPVSPGNSGGPLLNVNGEVIGVVSWQVKDGQNLNFAVPASYLLGLDKTLPSMPWDTVRPSTVSPAVRIATDLKQPEIRIPDLEQRIHELVDVQRKAKDQVQLAWDDELSKIARAHSEDMVKRKYFGHTDPEGLTPMKRAAAAGYNVCQMMGENIFQNNLYSRVIEEKKRNTTLKTYDWNSPEKIASTTVKSWMGSEEHRQNILSKNYIQEGIGVAVADDGKVYITQMLCGT
jgi:uncharacterized protein YkwD